MTLTQLLAHALQLEPIDAPLRSLPDGTYCVMTGEAITEGYNVMDITTSATNEFIDTFRGCPTGHVSESVGRCFKLWNLGSVLAFESGVHYRPLMSPVSALEQGRPCWRDIPRIVMERHRGEKAVVILATETKKRVWPKAKIGTVGQRMPVLVHDSGLGMLKNVYIDVPRLQEAIDIIHRVREAGFQAVKSGRAWPMLEGLFSDYKTAESIGFARTRELEAELKPWRRAPELMCAALIEGYSMKPPKAKDR